MRRAVTWLLPIASPHTKSRPNRAGFHAWDGGGPEGIRTPDLLNAIQTRSQLRHRPGRNGHVWGTRRHDITL